MDDSRQKVIQAVSEEIRRAANALAAAVNSLERLARILEESLANGAEPAGASGGAAPPSVPAPAILPIAEAPTVVIESSASSPATKILTDARGPAPAKADREVPPAPRATAATAATAREIVRIDTAPTSRVDRSFSGQRLEVAQDELDGLMEEIEQAERYLGDLPRKQRSAQIAVWAGRAREIQEKWQGDSRVPQERFYALKGVFGRLTGMTRRMDCTWIDALSSEWTVTWETYVAYNRALAAGRYPDLPPEEEAAYHRAILRGLFLAQRRFISPQEAGNAILDALQVLPEEDPELARALERFGYPEFARERTTGRRTRKVRREDGEDTAELDRPGGTKVVIPPEVLEITRGKNALLAGGQGSREEHRLAILKALEFSDLEWVTAERTQASPFLRLTERVASHKYDLVIYLASHASHKSAAFVRTCKDSGVPVAYLTKGYSVSSVVHAIKEQLVPGGPAA